MNKLFRGIKQCDYFCVVKVVVVLAETESLFVYKNGCYGRGTVGLPYQKIGKILNSPAFIDSVIPYQFLSKIRVRVCITCQYYAGTCRMEFINLLKMNDISSLLVYLVIICIMYTYCFPVLLFHYQIGLDLEMKATKLQALALRLLGKVTRFNDVDNELSRDKG